MMMVYKQLQEEQSISGLGAQLDVMDETIGRGLEKVGRHRNDELNR